MSIHKAELRHLRIAPRKVRLVADMIRGMSVNEAEARLLTDRHRSARSLLKLLRSALAGARAKELNPDSLYIQEIRVDQGPMLKRWMARAQGRGAAIQKKTSHVYLGLGENPAQKPGRFDIPRPAKKKSAEAAPEKKPRRAKKETPAKEEAKSEEKKETKKGGRRIFGRKSPSA